MTRTRGKVSSQAQTPPASPNSIQGVTVLGVANGEAAAHPTLVYVVR
jgi:hypothetical protein